MTSKELWWANARRELGLLPDAPRVFVAFMLEERRRYCVLQAQAATAEALAHAKQGNHPTPDVAEAARQDEQK